MIRIDGKEVAWKKGMTVSGLLSELRSEEAASCPVVRMNGKFISRPFFENTPVPDGAEVFLIPMIAGG
jgi:sulfur carrier protein ThiS